MPAIGLRVGFGRENLMSPIRLAIKPCGLASHALGVPGEEGETVQAQVQVIIIQAA